MCGTVDAAVSKTVFLRKIVSSSLTISTTFAVANNMRIQSKGYDKMVKWLGLRILNIYKAPQQLVTCLLFLLGLFFVFMTLILGLFCTNAACLTVPEFIIIRLLAYVIVDFNDGNCSFFDYRIYLYFMFLFEVIFNPVFLSPLFCGVAVQNVLKQHFSLLFYTLYFFFASSFLFNIL